MSKYQVVLTYLYKDTSEVEANSAEEAREIAEASAEEVYDCYYDSDVVLLEEGKDGD